MTMVVVLGEGAWGTAIAHTIAGNGHQVLLWCHDPATAREITTSRTNTKFLPGISLHKNIEAITDASRITAASFIAETIPVPFLRAVLGQLRTHVRPEHCWIVLSKGIEQETGFFPAQIIDDVMKFKARIVAVAGPSFAKELALQRLTALTLAGAAGDVRDVQQLLVNSFVVGVSSDDVFGVQVGAALKNVIALGAGIVQGAGLGDNARALCITHGLHEIMHVAHVLGGRRETLLGLAGLGDVILSVTSTSRNYAIGVLIGQGTTVQELSRRVEILPESINTLCSLNVLMQRNKTHVPLCAALYRVVMERAPVSEIVAALTPER